MLAGGAQAWAATACVLAGIPPEVTMRIVGHEDYQTTVNIDTRIQERHLRNPPLILPACWSLLACQLSVHSIDAVSPRFPATFRQLFSVPNRPK